MGRSEEAQEPLENLLVRQSPNVLKQIPHPSKPALYSVRVDNVEIDVDDRWPWQAHRVEFLDNISGGKDCSDSVENTIEKLKNSQSIIYALDESSASCQIVRNCGR